MYSVSNNSIAAQYDSSINSGRYESDYEFNRWFIRGRNRAEYYMTYRAIKHDVASLQFTRCLELGPGPGTWTRLLFRHNPDAHFQLVDISTAMRDQFQLEMRGGENISYNVSDIMKFETDVDNDCFFSSRAVEYLSDKPAFFSRLNTFMDNGASGIIITKNPYHGVRKSKKAAHQGQISMSQMKQYLEANNFTDVQFYPVVYRIPIISRLTSEVAEFLFERRHSKQLAIKKANRIVESYIVTFTKTTQ